MHGTDDHYFPVSDAEALHAAAGGELWLERGMRHAESATTPELWTGWRAGPAPPSSGAPSAVERAFRGMLSRTPVGVRCSGAKVNRTGSPRPRHPLPRETDRPR
ncbi:hypothetical protein GCM10020366_71380 [Saccharopolyspora gregorii]|uniref:Alpha/beta hydrolase n=1 Tax=Saccharopolyspora gregorii TaxID=33914 RepID=A0ABP6S3Y3_9PSEU